MKNLLHVIAAVALLGCANPGVKTLEEAKQAVRRSQFDRLELEFSEMKIFPGNTVCGNFSGTDEWGRGSKGRRFIVRDGRANTRPSNEDWQVYCNGDPAAGLMTAFGIGPVDDSNAPLRKIHRDLAALDRALQAYEADNYGLPSEKQGLEALVSLSAIPPRPLRYREGGYLEALPTDPWNRPYLYEPSPFGGVKGSYVIRTLGADGVEGGRGEDADIGNRHLQYLDHIGNL